MEDKDPDGARPAPPERERALGRTAARGAAWTLLQTAVQKGCGYLALIPLGYLLLPNEWGVYATAMAFASFVMIMRDGGMRELLIQRGVREYEGLVGPIFWVSVLINLATASLLAIAAPFAADFYDDARMTALILIPAATLAVSTPSLMLRTRLRIDLRFGLLSQLAMVSALIRWGGAVALAFLGFGPKSLVIPLLVVAIFEWIVLEIMIRERLWRRPMEVRRWFGLFWQTKWLIFGAYAALTLNMGPFLVLGKLVDPAVLGIYFFGYQLVAQIAVMLSANLTTVFLPTFARLNAEPKRQRAAVLRSLRSLVLLACPLSLGLAAVIWPLEALIWRGKYADAVIATQLLAVAFPMRVTYGLITSALKARGDFRAWAVITLLQGVGVMATAVAVGLLHYGVTGIGAGIAAYLAVSSTIVLLVTMRLLGISARSTLGALLPGWILSVTLAGLCVATDHLVLANQPLVLRIGVLGLFFAVGYTALTRMLMPVRCVETVGVLPAFVRRPAERLLGLGAR